VNLFRLLLQSFSKGGVSTQFIQRILDLLKRSKGVSPKIHAPRGGRVVIQTSKALFYNSTHFEEEILPQNAETGNCRRYRVVRREPLPEPNWLNSKHLGSLTISSAHHGFLQPRYSFGPSYGRALSANMRETVTPGKFRVEGESGLESDD
jgi:hypothetical protein